MNFSWKSWLHLAHDCACTTGQPWLVWGGKDGWQGLQTAGPPAPLNRWTAAPWPGKVLCLKVVIWSGKRCCNSCGDAWNVWGFLVWMFGNCCWSKFVKAGGLSWVIPFSITSPVQQLALDQRWILKTFMKEKKMHMWNIYFLYAKSWAIYCKDIFHMFVWLYSLLIWSSLFV